MNRGPASERLDRASSHLEPALAGDVVARRALMVALMPVVQARVARMLARAPGQHGREPRQELMDLMQEVFLALFEDDAKALRAWAPDRGLSLANWVGLIAERQTVSILRSGRRTPFKETPTELDDLDDALEPTAGPELGLLSRDLLTRLADRLRETLSPKGLDLFYRLFVEETSVEDVARETGMTADALYAWRSRLAKHIRVLARELSPESSKMSVQGPAARNP
ncbi:MAG: sigma-70 family RNA polymerase sigma factor [Myxococcales bacterium]|nr:sigma-70 family RNA polymerase sigma factor [Myxococcales bacterium]